MRFLRANWAWLVIPALIAGALALAAWFALDGGVRPEFRYQL
jgi:hypothetical protein